MQTVKISGDIRTDLGKKGSKAVRNAGQVPCVLYGSQGNVHFSAAPKSIKPLVYTPDFKIAEIEVDGNTYKCIIKDVQFHPVTENFLHVDFLQMEENRPVKVSVPVRFEGTSPGVKTGGVLQKTLRRVKIKATPENMVDQLIGNISKLKMGMSLRVKDLELPDGVELISSPSIPVVAVLTPRAMKGKAVGEEEEEEEVETLEETAEE